MKNITDSTTVNKAAFQTELFPSGDSILEQLTIEPSSGERKISGESGYVLR